MAAEPTDAVFPEPGAWGPTNNLVALANHLRERGIRVVFVIEESFEGELEKRGFEEALMRMAPPPEHEEQVGEGWAEFIRVAAPEFRKPTIEQLETVTMPIWAELAEGAKYAHERLLEIWDDVRPDVIVTDGCMSSGLDGWVPFCDGARRVRVTDGAKSRRLGLSESAARLAA